MKFIKHQNADESLDLVCRMCPTCPVECIHWEDA